MLSIFRLLMGRARNPSRAGGRNRGSGQTVLPADPEPIPVPDVVEGNGGESDWNLWQDSVLTLDSQFQQLGPASAGHDKTQPLSADELNGYVKARRGGASS